MYKTMIASGSKPGSVCQIGSSPKMRTCRLLAKAIEYGPVSVYFHGPLRFCMAGQHLGAAESRRAECDFASPKNDFLKTINQASATPHIPCEDQLRLLHNRPRKYRGYNDSLVEVNEQFNTRFALKPARTTVPPCSFP